MHPTRSLEAVSHLALREKLFNFTVKKRILSYKAPYDPPWGQVNLSKLCQKLHALTAQNFSIRLRTFTFTG